MNARKSIVLSGAAICLMSASDLAKFYHPVPHRSADVETATDPTFHPSSGDAKQDVSAMASAGYELVGYSAFNGKEAGEKRASKQAKKIGATDVVYLEKYTDTQTAGAISSASFSPWSAFGIVTPISVRRYD